MALDVQAAGGSTTRSGGPTAASVAPTRGSLRAPGRALGDAKTVLNVGARTGSYEPPDRQVVAVEPSETMRAQRLPVAARSEAVPSIDDAFDAAMAVLSDHHWEDRIAGLREMRRVAKRVVVFQWDNTRIGEFWLVRDYLPEFLATAQARPTLAQRAAAIDAEMAPVPIPWDCHDGFFHSYWRRPEAYLQPAGEARNLRVGRRGPPGRRQSRESATRRSCLWSLVSGVNVTTISCRSRWPSSAQNS
jgi:SAM-dependent methyltransferase